MTVVESLVQVTVVAGPPVELQVRVNELSVFRVKVMPPDNVTCPVDTKRKELVQETTACLMKNENSNSMIKLLSTLYIPP